VTKRTKEILDRLDKEYGTEYICYLNHENPWQLLIAVILSAQCTDARVNIVTKDLFKKYDSLEKFANANLEELEQDIKPTGFYHNKAKNIIEASKQLVINFDGQVPQETNELMSLSGVGRKTANVVRAVGFKIPAIAVDTHVFRVSNRLGLASAKDVTNTEKQLMKNVKKKDWIDVHHMLILFGRYYCKALNPRCENCAFKYDCKYVREKKK